MTVRRNAAKYADFSEVVDACVDTGAKCLLEAAGDGRALGVGEVSPEQVLRVREDPLDVQFFALAGQRAQREIEHLPRRERLPRACRPTA